MYLIKGSNFPPILLYSFLGMGKIAARTYVHTHIHTGVYVYIYVYVVCFFLMECVCVYLKQTFHPHKHTPTYTCI